MILKLTNNLTKNTLSFEVNDLYLSNIYFNFEISLNENIEGIALKDILEGEYTYNLYDEENIIATGLLQIGDYKANNKQYNNKKTYKVYGE